jgi:26S proteasome regulatory subunit T6
MPVAVQAPTPTGGIKSYYQTKIEAAELLINQKTQNLRRLEAQRNALNARGKSSVFSSILNGCLNYDI